MPKVYQNIFSLLTHFAHDFLPFSYGNTTECLCAPLEEKKRHLEVQSLFKIWPLRMCVLRYTTFMCAKCSFCLCVCKENTFNCVAILYNKRWPLETVAVYYKHTHKNSTANKRKTEQNMGRKWLHDGHKNLNFNSYFHSTFKNRKHRDIAVHELLPTFDEYWNGQEVIFSSVVHCIPSSLLLKLDDSIVPRITCNP